MSQLGLQFTTSGLEVAGITISYLQLSLELFLIGLLVMLEVVLLLRLKYRAARTKHLREQTQVRARSAYDTEEVQHRAEVRERQHIQQQAWTLPQAATAVQKVATPTDQRLADQFCSHCGQLMPAGAAFCSQCGVLLVASGSGHLKPPPPARSETSLTQHVMCWIDPHSTDKSVSCPPDRVLYNGDELPQSLPSALSAPDVLDKSVSCLPDRVLYSGDGQIAPVLSGIERTDVARSSDGVQPSTDLAVGALSHPGIKRQHRPNEDSLFAAQSRRLQSSQPQSFGVFIVADGMGGHRYGQEASRQAIQTLIDHLLPRLSENSELQETDLRQLLIDGVQAANQAIYHQNQEQGTDMGTTITAAVVIGLTAFVANVGDSRTYLYQEPEGLRKITNDHSVVAYLVETGVIQPEDIYTHVQRNRIYRNLGAKPMIQVDVFMERLQPGNTLLLCSDGLWEMVRDPAIEQILRNGADPSQTSSALLEAALAGGGADNVSVIVVQVTEATRQTGMMGLQLLTKPDAVELPEC